MARVLTGIQSSGKPHLGNILGAILPAIKMSNDTKDESFFFIADLHSLTTLRDSDLIKENVYATAAAWLAFGFDTSKNIFYKQSDISEVCEFTWYLNCFTPYPMLANAHSFKDKSDNLSNVNSGLFTYPVLMAADILMYDANTIPVGKDQQQHVEMTRDIAGHINNVYGEVLVIPESKIDINVMIIPGTDGRKMSKSYDNCIDVFLPEKELKKQIMKIITETSSLEDKKDPGKCNVFNIYKLIASEAQTKELYDLYINGNFGFGTAKKMLLDLILDKFSKNREKYNYLMENKNLIDKELEIGARKAKKIASEVLSRLKNSLGF